ncbi:hypothetical protein [Brevundimonas sp.]|uniref:hypothetical protein n=1 Tax=Brevundimonas sp. TaxID=1871086 RepID=UPI002D2282D8|nr:hypothetical protein [Brevundimonas sp.]HYD29193.1 hypothetical protein [Brevundimonas sp.]
MSRTIRLKNALLLAVTEAEAGVYEDPTASTDSIKVENCRLTFDPNMIETNEYTGSLDASAPIVGGMRASLAFDVLLKGSGTAGTAPEWGVLMPACNWQEVASAAAVPVAAEALAAGGSTTTAVLGATALGTANLYRGMPIVFSEAVEGTSFIAAYSAGKTATLTDTLGGALVATSDYQIPANVLYRPVSGDPDALSMRFYQDGTSYKFRGCRGDWSLRADAGGVGRLSYTMTGIFVAEEDAGVPTGAFQAGQAPVWRNGVMSIGRAAVALSSLTLASGNQVVSQPNPNAEEGFDVADIMSRRITGTLDPKKGLKATADRLGHFKAGTPALIHARWGTTAGNRIGITVPAAQYTRHELGEREGAAITNLSFQTTGEDAGAFLTIW